jgi:hypothetical protein
LYIIATSPPTGNYCQAHTHDHHVLQNHHVIDQVLRRRHHPLSSIQELHPRAPSTLPTPIPAENTGAKRALQRKRCTHGGCAYACHARGVGPIVTVMGSGAAEYWSSGTPVGRGTISNTPRGGRGEEEGRAWTPCVSDVFGGIPMGGSPNKGVISVVLFCIESRHGGPAP